MDASVRGLPLLSGPPRAAFQETSGTAPDEPECRKCRKEFGLFTRRKMCMHCGYSYCSTCCDHQALMPRERASADSGYEVVQVCGYCINFLTLTAAGRAQLKLYSIPRLKAYLKAYGIPFPTGALEKDDFVQTILEARESNGCLSADREVYYRRFSVPNSNGSPSGERARSRNIFTRINDAFSPPQSVPTQPRPAQTTGSYGSRPYYTSRPTPRPAGQSSQEQARASPAYQTNAGPQASRSPFHAPSTQSSSQRTTTSPPPRPSSPPVPSLSELLNLTDDELSALSSHTLKEVLHQNHVNARLILEKSDLIDKVKLLIEAERSQRQREEDARRMEEEEAIARQHRLMEELRQRNQMKEVEHATSTTTSEAGDASQPPDPHQDSSPSKDLKPTMLERQGLCVVCQDSEANMAIVDCGHLAMCMACSELVMQSSRECPLCRTRIVTPERLLRIFRT